MENINLAVICPDLGLDFGRSRVVFQIVSNFASNTNYNVTLITNKKSNLNELKNHNLKIKYIPISIVGRNPINFLLALVKFIIIIRSEKIKLVHSHHRYSDLLVYFVSKFVKIKTLTTVHSFTFGYHLFSYPLDRVICVSYDLKKHVEVEFKVDAEKLKVIYNGISKPIISTEKKNNTNFENNELTVLCVGRFDYDKGQDILLRAFKKIWKLDLKICLELIGEYSPNVIKYAKKNNDKIRKKFIAQFEKLVNDNCNRIKILSSSSTPWNEIDEADIIVIPSRIETFGLVALEAGILRKCVIASNTGGLKEIIHNHENGILFESENISELTEKILYLFENQHLITEFGAKLNKDVLNKFNNKIMIEKYLQIYNEF